MANNKSRAKVYWTATCNRGKHGKPGYKSTAGFFFVGVPEPKNKREQTTQGCAGCRKEATNVA